MGFTFTVMFFLQINSGRTTYYLFPKTLTSSCALPGRLVAHSMSNDRHGPVQKSLLCVDQRICMNNQPGRMLLWVNKQIHVLEEMLVSGV